MRMQMSIEQVVPAVNDGTGEKVFLVNFLHVALSGEELQTLLGKTKDHEITVEVQ